ncbi:MAG TPA: hypothetical protein VFW40_02235 [Capsulimonadaceae bacterium]|nr:hypothetical protein [Capsulimonadaceae bacterium]
MIKMLDRAALPVALVLAIGLIGKAAQAFPVLNVVPESSSINLLMPGLLVVGGFFLFKAIRARSGR